MTAAVPNITADQRPRTPGNPWEVVTRKVALGLPSLSRATAAFVTHCSIPKLYPLYLSVMYSVTRASVPLMKAAIASAEVLGDADAAAVSVRRYLEDHLPEEEGHDLLILHDLDILRKLGKEPPNSRPSIAAARLVGTQYYWIQHYHPVALLGYVYVMEGHVLTSSGIEEMVRRTGYPPEAFTTLFLHAQLDPVHTDDLAAVLTSLALTTAQLDLVTTSALHTLECQIALLADIFRYGSI